MGAAVLAAKGMGLAALFALRLSKLLADVLDFLFQFSSAPIALLAPGASRAGRSHGALTPQASVSGVAKRQGQEMLDPRCISMIARQARGSGRFRRLSGGNAKAVNGNQVLLNDPRDEVHVLMAESVSAGFAELDRRTEGEIELVQFGLTRDFIGQGLRKYFLQWTVDKAWSYGPWRFWLHTCTKEPGCPAELPEGGFRHLQRRGQGSMIMQE
jgi:hypothetical protein